ncbi:MAG: hypothetical protein H6742_07205 [Alphaproteobacteria bacterium]|nr:hypothetical protein [Alphaproteobacteria bacterium]
MFHRSSRTLGVALAMFALGGPALANPNAVEGETLVDANAEELKAWLSDYGLIAEINADIYEYSVEAAPPCELVHVKSRGVGQPMLYTVKRCPTADGFKETMISGDQLEAMEAEWSVKPEGDRSRVKVRIFTKINLVPQFLVNQAGKKSIGQMLKNLTTKVDAKAR